MTRKRSLELLLINDGIERSSRESYPKKVLKFLSPKVFLTSPLSSPAFSSMPFQQGTGSIFDRMDAYVAASNPLKKSTGGLSVGSLLERMDAYVAASNPLESSFESKPFDLSTLKLNLSCLNPSSQAIGSEEPLAKLGRKSTGGLSVGSLLERMDDDVAANNPLKQFDWLNVDTPKFDPGPLEIFKQVKLVGLGNSFEMRPLKYEVPNFGKSSVDILVEEKPLWERLGHKPFELPKVDFDMGIVTSPKKKSKLPDGTDWMKYLPGHSVSSDDSEEEKPLWQQKMEFKPVGMPKMEFPVITPFSSDSDSEEEKPLWQQKMEFKPSTFELPKVDFTKLNGGFDITKQIEEARKYIDPSLLIPKKKKSKSSCHSIGNDFPIYSPEPVTLNLENTANSFKIFDSHKKGAPLVRYDQKPHEFGAPHLQYGERDFTGRTGQEAADIFADILTKSTKIKWPFESEDRSTVW